MRIFHFPAIYSNRIELWKHEEEEEEKTYKRFITYEKFSKECERTHLPPQKRHNVCEYGTTLYRLSRCVQQEG